MGGLRDSRFYYHRFYRLVAVAVAVMTAVLTGSLVIGDSVRSSLANRVSERLAGAETIVQTGTGFLSDSILRHSLLASARGYLLAEGFVSSEGQMVPVTVWGGDQQQTYINEVLARRLGVDDGQPVSLVLHLPSTRQVPSSSLFVSQRYATQLRLAVNGVKNGSNGGNLLLHNEQIRPLNIFMSRQRLAEALGLEGKINVILSPDRFTADDFRHVWHPDYSGLHSQTSALLLPPSVLHLPSSALLPSTTLHLPPSTIVSTDRVLLTKPVVDALQPSARYLAYFVNSLGTIPYSFVTATDQLHGDETMLSDYAARRLNAQVGDSVTMEYYVSRGELKQLLTGSHRFRVSAIVPLSQFQQQAALLTADFPGLSGVERCTDWDSDLPIDMSRITPADEDYWAEYWQTPKALVSLDAVGSDWTGYYGEATKVVTASSAVSLLTPEAFGLMVVMPREAALSAAQNGTDFGLLFLALGFFIIIAAILLMQNPLSEMYHLRRPEFQLYSALGFSRRQVFCRLFREALPVVLLSSPVGVFLGYAYAATVLWLLAGPWSGATHTDGFVLSARPLTVVVACAVSLLLALGLLCLALRSALHPSPSTLHPSSSTLHPSPSTLHPLSLTSLIRASLSYYRRQHRLSFWTLALGVLVVFAVGLNRPDFSHSDSEATGGYQYYGESRIPIQYDLNEPAARHHLHLDGLGDTRFLQLPKHTEDEASCLNLNKVATPSVLGMDVMSMARFGIDTTQLKTHSATVPVVIDQEALLWSMMRQVGDTLTYHASDGREVKAVIAASYPTGIFHGHAIMPLGSYRQLWPDEMGSRVILSEQLRVKSEEFLDEPSGEGEHRLKRETPSLVETLNLSLSDYGFTTMPTTDRLRLFFEVTDTYLSIFLSLGGLGLLLGLVSLFIVIRKNLVARQAELRLYRALGFSSSSVVAQLRREQIIVPLLAIVTGLLLAVVITLLLPLTSILFSPTAIILFLLMIAFTCIIIHISINQKTIKQCETS